MDKVLYEHDFVMWIEKTVEQLKTQNFSALDLEHLIDEVESLGKREKRELKNHLITLFEHLYKTPLCSYAGMLSWLGVNDS